MSKRLNDSQLTEIKAQLAQGQKILAIKLYRDSTGIGLRDAKDFVDSLAVAPGSAHKTIQAPTSNQIKPTTTKYRDNPPNQKASHKWPLQVGLVIVVVAIVVWLWCDGGCW